MVEPTPLKHISQIGSSPQVGVKNTNYLVITCYICKVGKKEYTQTKSLSEVIKDDTSSFMFSWTDIANSLPQQNASLLFHPYPSKATHATRTTKTLWPFPCNRASSVSPLRWCSLCHLPSGNQSLALSTFLSFLASRNGHLLKGGGVLKIDDFFSYGWNS